MKLFLILAFAFMAMPVPTPARAAGPARVEAETLPPLNAPLSPKKGENQPSAPVAATEGEDKPLTAEEQAQLLCQATQVMGSTGDADYQPGVDAYGRAVVPADGNAQPVFSVPERVDIPLNIALLQDSGIITTPTLDLATNVGNVSILKGGQVLFNGQDLTSPVQTYCNTHMKKDIQ